MTVILGIKLEDRLETATEFQKIITHFGCAIHTRVGLHKSDEKSCNSYGIILLEIIDNKIATELEKELLQINNIETQRMIFN